MAFGKHQDPSIGKKTQFPNNDPTKGGRKGSFRKELDKLLGKEGQLLIKRKDVVEIQDNGDVLITLPDREALVLHLLKIAKGKTPNNLKAIQLILEHLEGKPTQPIAFADFQNVPTIFIDATQHNDLS